MIIKKFLKVTQLETVFDFHFVSSPQQSKYIRL